MNATERLTAYLEIAKLGLCQDDDQATMIRFASETAALTVGDLREIAAALAAPSGEPVAYRLGNAYRTQAGEWVTLVEVSNEGTHYETMACAAGVHRYTRRDFGRVTGSAHDYSDPRNIPPLYTRPAAAEAAPPAGWVLVPREPTNAMLAAAGYVENYDIDAGGDSDADHLAWWTAMLAAGPLARQGEECTTCNGAGLIGGVSGQTPESYEEVSEACPDCSHPAQGPQRADYPAEFKRRLQSAVDGIVPPKMSPLKTDLFTAGCRATVRAINAELERAAAPQEPQA